MIGLDLFIIIGTLLFANGESVGRPASPVLVALAVWWSLPALVLLLMRTRAGLAVVALVLLLGTALALRNIYVSTSSTAAIGFFTVPMLGLVFAAACLAADALAARLRR